MPDNRYAELIERRSVPGELTSVGGAPRRSGRVDRCWPSLGRERQPKVRTMRTIIGLLAVLSLGGCDRSEEPARILVAPRGDYRVPVFESDLGACCSSKVSARIIGSGEFLKLDEDLFEVFGASDVQLSWLDPDHLQIKVCNANNVFIRSDFRAPITAGIFM